MSVDADFEQESILERARELLVGGRVHNGIPDEAEVARTPSGSVLPYLVIEFANGYALGEDRSLAGEIDQPQILPIRMEAWAASERTARAVAGAVREQFIGWHASPSSSEITSGVAGGFRNRTSTGAPSRFVETVALELIYNLGSNDGFAPSPGGPAAGGVPVRTIEQIVAGLLGEAVAPPVRYDFPTPVAEWPMPHSFGRIPSFRAYTLDGERLLAGEVATTTLVSVTYAKPQSGFAILS